MLETLRLGERHGVFDDAGRCQLRADRLFHYASRVCGFGLGVCGLGLCACCLRLCWRSRGRLLAAAHLEEKLGKLL